MSNPLRSLGSLTVEAFMSEYWQKRPVLLRGALDPWSCPIDPDELFELACRDDADARLILGAEDPPEIFHGPFEPDDFADLPDDAWTVLVQEVDRLLPAVASLQDHFRFLPNWRLDDVMVSYARPGGGVGAHIDQYDVFLVQGSGRRRWEIETTPVPDPVWRDDSEVAILAAFEPDEAWVLDPGDVLYLPPGIPHNGVALEPCLTLSVGFRAPDAAELLSGIAALAAEETGGSGRFSDPELSPTDDAGLFPESARQTLRRMVRDALADDERLDRWLGRHVTEPVRGWTGDPPERPLDVGVLRSRVESGYRFRAGVAAQCCYVAHADGSSTLFAAGVAYDLPPGSVDVARSLTRAGGPDPEAAAAILVDPDIARVVVALLNAGSFVLSRP